jgi:beta-galactosidase
MELVDPTSGDALRIEADGKVLHMSATRYTAHDLFAANDQTELVAQPHLVVHIDVAHRGLGTASCGPDTLPQYQIGAGSFHFAYVVSLIRHSS